MDDAYRLQRLAQVAAEETNVRHLLRKGTYCFVSGPSYETPAESRWLASIGDAVGMSTVPEIIVARHCGISVLGLSLMTNKVVLPGDVDQVPASHEEVLAATKQSTSYVQALVSAVVSRERLGPYLAQLQPFVYTPTPEYKAYKIRKTLQR